MVVKIQVTVKHIRGHTFQIDADVESDVLGLKVLIWESQKIAIENQRLVFGGTELGDNLKLAELSMGENAMIFLVESNSEIPQHLQEEAPPTTQAPIQSQVIAPSTTQIPMSTCSYNKNCAYKCPYQQVRSADYYEPFDDESVLSEERMQSVIALGKWIRIYCILGMIVSLISTINCLYCLIPTVMYTLGWLGTRKLNRCLLVFPLLISMILGFGLFGTTTYLLIKYYDGYEFLLLFISILHIMIFSCICRFMCRISKLSCQEWWQARLRIQSRCCC